MSLHVLAYNMKRVNQYCEGRSAVESDVAITTSGTRQSLWRTVASYKIGPLPIPMYVAIAAITILPR
jgi:hypothetical protein